MAGRTVLKIDTSEACETVVPAAGPDLTSTAVLQELHKGLLFLLRRKVRDPALADDLCNEAFGIVLERVRQQPLEEPAKLSAYLAQTARNLWIAEQRKTVRRRTATGEQSAIDEFADPQAADSVTVAHKQSCARAVREVLQQLPIVRDRELLVRYYLNDEDKADICHDLNLTEDHFNRVIFRARERFRILLEKRYSQSDLL